jgi:hypothetical protein
MELFTRGIGHFSEGDVKEAARALTGWAVADGAFLEYAANHDPGEKTILGRSVPQSSAVLAEPRSARDLMVTSVSGWLLAYDNISVLPRWLSDSLCRLATGGGMPKCEGYLPVSFFARPGVESTVHSSLGSG